MGEVVGTQCMLKTLKWLVLDEAKAPNCSVHPLWVYLPYFCMMRHMGSHGPASWFSLSSLPTLKILGWSGHLKQSCGLIWVWLMLKCLASHVNAARGTVGHQPSLQWCTDPKDVSAWILSLIACKFSLLSLANLTNQGESWPRRVQVDLNKVILNKGRTFSEVSD